MNKPFDWWIIETDISGPTRWSRTSTKQKPEKKWKYSKSIKSIGSIRNKPFNTNAKEANRWWAEERKWGREKVQYFWPQQMKKNETRLIVDLRPTLRPSIFRFHIDFRSKVDLTPKPVDLSENGVCAGRNWTTRASEEKPWSGFYRIKRDLKEINSN